MAYRSNSSSAKAGTGKLKGEMDVFDYLLPSIRATLALTAFTGLIFPLVITATAQILFPYQSGGSLVRDGNGQVIGARIIGQQFSRLEYFHPRPSAAGSGYAGESSAGANLGPTSAKLIEGIEDNPATDVNESFAGIKQLALAYTRENSLSTTEKIPVDAVTRSGSGLDPDISQDNALIQARRVARARSLPVEQVLDLVRSHIEGRQFGVLGEPHVNVLALNLALDRLKR